MHVGIAGVGLVGRLVALNLLQKGYKVTLFDRDESLLNHAAGVTAAGMLAPFAELESAESVIFEYGKTSIVLWRDILEQLQISEAMQQEGTVIVAHPQDKNELQHFIALLQSKVAEAKEIQSLDKEAIGRFEPDLNMHEEGFFLPLEGQVDSQQFMQSSKAYLLEHENVADYLCDEVVSVESKTITTNNKKHTFDWVFDTRGLGAKEQLKGLRGVRGEVLWVETSEVTLTRPVRLMHPRYRLYIVPRPNNQYVIGATQIESEDMSPISVRSSLELLSALYSVHKGFAEARVIKTQTNCRPSMPDNLPYIENEEGMTRINGLYRHGYLLAPAVVQEALTKGVYSR